LLHNTGPIRHQRPTSQARLPGGKIEAAEHDIARKREALANVDAVILLYEPEATLI
jgi:hypothetical protein